MKIKDARTINAAALYKRRKQAIMLFKKGMKRHEIASIVSVHRLTVGIWIKNWQKGGLESLKASSSGRRKDCGRKLNKIQELAIMRMIVDKCPGQLKLNFPLWTRQAVRELIWRKFHIKISLQSVFNYFKRWKIVPANPFIKGVEWNALNIEKRIQKVYPLLLKKAKNEKATIRWCDTIALTRKAPIIQTINIVPKAVNLMCVISNRGQVHFMFYRMGSRIEPLTKFLKRLVRCISHKIIIILDDFEDRRSKALNVWLDTNKKMIEIYYLPDLYNY